MEIVVVALIVIETWLNIYLQSFANEGKLPRVAGFYLTANLVRVFVLVMSVWYLGWLWGIVVALLVFFGLVYLCWSWILDFPMKLISSMSGEERTLNSTLFGLYYWVFLGFPIVTILSFFLVPFEYGLVKFSSLENGVYWLVGASIAGS